MTHSLFDVDYVALGFSRPVIKFTDKAQLDAIADISGILTLDALTS